MTINSNLKRQMTDVKENTFILESVDAAIFGSETELPADIEDTIMDPDAIPEEAFKKIDKLIDDVVERDDMDDELELIPDDIISEEDIDDFDDDDFEDE